jgi:hypothetical protein
MSMQLYVGQPKDWRNARYLAVASDLAYLGADEGPAQFKEKLGLDAKLISVDNTQAYVGQNGESIVVAFRGTESPATFDGLKDWLLTNACDYLVLPEGEAGTDFAAAGVGARFHKGFLTALEMVWADVSRAVLAHLEEGRRPFWVTGHSLGGALALLASWRFSRSPRTMPHQVYTFGAPMIGNEAAASAFEREMPDKIYRYTGTLDPIPLLPSVSLVANTYGHCPLQIAVGGEPCSAEALKEMAGGEAGDVSPPVADSLWNNLKTRIDSHSMVTYMRFIDQECSQLG